MDPGVTSAMAAITGAVVGGLTSLASTWVRERSQYKRELIQREIAKRETTYSEFIEQASKLYVASATHHLDDDDTELTGLVSLYAVLSRIQLCASDQVIMEAQNVIDRIVRQYGDENVSAEQLRMSTIAKKDDPLKAFSVVCRHELRDIQRGI
jgi:hypothetical protein